MQRLLSKLFEMCEQLFNTPNCLVPFGGCTHSTGAIDHRELSSFICVAPTWRLWIPFRNTPSASAAFQTSVRRPYQTVLVRLALKPCKISQITQDTTKGTDFWANFLEQ